MTKSTEKTSSFFPLTAAALVEKITDGLAESDAQSNTIILKEYRDPMVLHQRFHPDSNFVAPGNSARIRAGYSADSPQLTGTITKSYAAPWQPLMGTISTRVDNIPEAERHEAIVSVIEITVDRQAALDILPKVQEMAARQKPKGRSAGRA